MKGKSLIIEMKEVRWVMMTFPIWIFFQAIFSSTNAHFIPANIEKSFTIFYALVLAVLILLEDEALDWEYTPTIHKVSFVIGISILGFRSASFIENIIEFNSRSQIVSLGKMVSLTAVLFVWHLGQITKWGIHNNGS